jgi:hypothetical protein
VHVAILPAEVGVYVYAPASAGFPRRTRLPDYFLDFHQPVSANRDWRQRMLATTADNELETNKRMDRAAMREFVQNPWLTSLG